MGLVYYVIYFPNPYPGVLQYSTGKQTDKVDRDESASKYRDNNYFRRLDELWIQNQDIRYLLQCVILCVRPQELENMKL